MFYKFKVIIERNFWKNKLFSDNGECQAYKLVIKCSLLLVNIFKPKVFTGTVSFQAVRNINKLFSTWTLLRN